MSLLPLPQAGGARGGASAASFCRCRCPPRCDQGASSQASLPLPLAGGDMKAGMSHHTSAFASSSIVPVTSLGWRIISVCAAPDGIIGKQLRSEERRVGKELCQYV